MSLHCFFLPDACPCCHTLSLLNKTTFSFFTKNKNSVSCSGPSGRFSCENFNSLVEAFELERGFSQAKNFMRLPRFCRAIFQAASQVLVGMCPVGLWHG